MVYAIKSLFAPIVDRRARIIEVKQTEEEKHTNLVQMRLKDTVFAGDCSNWYICKHGRNAASWPAKAGLFWFETYFPNWRAFTWKGGALLWPFYRLGRWMKMHSWTFELCLLFAALVVFPLRKDCIPFSDGSIRQELRRLISFIY